MNFKKITLFLLLSICASCSRSSEGNTSILSRWNFLKNLWGGSNEEFIAHKNVYGSEEYVSLDENDLTIHFTEAAIPQSKDIPGSAESGIPSLDQFKKAFADLGHIFQTVYFNTDDYVLRRPEYLQIIDKMARYLKSHPNMHVSIAGHCDERGSESYNLSLGAKRANYIRNLLIQKGIHPNNLHSVSYGKEQPLDLGHNSASWSRNRRTEFKIYEK